MKQFFWTRPNRWAMALGVFLVTPTIVCSQSAFEELPTESGQTQLAQNAADKAAKKVEKKASPKNAKAPSQAKPKKPSTQKKSKGPKVVAGQKGLKKADKAASKSEEDKALEAEGIDALSDESLEEVPADSGLDKPESAPDAPLEEEVLEDEPSAATDSLDESVAEKSPEAPPAAQPKVESAAVPKAEPSTPAATPLEESESLPRALLEESDPGTGLEPEEQFFRVPLRPAMSDANWAKWAGPSLEKFYRVRRGDTLWAVSERLFGTPYLWPKVWQLNAQFLNPHVIEVGQELQFIPGNTNSAPVLAFKKPDGTEEDLSLFVVEEKLSLLERLESVFLTQFLSPDPPFRYFLKESKPIPVGSMPDRRGDDRILFSEGDRFNLDMADGTYSVVRSFPMRDRVTRLASFQGWSVEWIGLVDVKNGRGHLRRAFKEVRSGDELTMDEFSLAPLSLHMAQLNPEEPIRFKYAPIQMGQMILPGDYSIVGLQLGSADEGPKEGGILKLYRRNVLLGTGVVLHRSGRLATLWLVDTKREVISPDTIR